MLVDTFSDYSVSGLQIRLPFSLWAWALRIRGFANNYCKPDWRKGHAF